MATTSSFSTWPAEGLPLIDALSRVIPEQWARYQAAIAATSDRRRRKAVEAAQNSMRHAFVEAWLRGDVVVKARPRVPWAKPQVIPASASRYLGFYLDANTARSRHGRLFDLRVYAAGGDNDNKTIAIKAIDAWTADRSLPATRTAAAKRLNETLLPHMTAPSIVNLLRNNQIGPWAKKPR
jgi:hypothetical protein